MKIDVEIRNRFENTSSPLKATATVTIEDCFVIHGVKLINTGQGMFMSMPSFRGRTGKWVSICHPIVNECRLQIQNALIDAYGQE